MDTPWMIATQQCTRCPSDSATYWGIIEHGVTIIQVFRCTVCGLIETRDTTRRTPQ